MSIELILKAQSGDTTAFAQLVQQHDRAVLALIARFVHSSEDAKDLYQEVLIRLFRGLPGFRFKSEFSTWVHRVTVNTCLSHQSKAERVVRPLLRRDESGEMAVSEVPSPDRGPDELSMNAETESRIQAALQTLSPRQRMVFVLRHYEGKALREIAQTLRCTEGTAKRYLFDGTRRLREQTES